MKLMKWTWMWFCWNVYVMQILRWTGEQSHTCTNAICIHCVFRAKQKPFCIFRCSKQFHEEEVTSKFINSCVWMNCVIRKGQPFGMLPRPFDSHLYKHCCVIIIKLIIIGFKNRSGNNEKLFKTLSFVIRHPNRNGNVPIARNNKRWRGEREKNVT